MTLGLALTFEIHHHWHERITDDLGFTKIKDCCSANTGKEKTRHRLGENIWEKSMSERILIHNTQKPLQNSTKKQATQLKKNVANNPTDTSPKTCRWRISRWEAAAQHVIRRARSRRWDHYANTRQNRQNVVRMRSNSSHSLLVGMGNGAATWKTGFLPK